MNIIERAAEAVRKETEAEQAKKNRQNFHSAQKLIGYAEAICSETFGGEFETDTAFVLFDRESTDTGLYGVLKGDHSVCFRFGTRIFDGKREFSVAIPFETGAAIRKERDEIILTSNMEYIRVDSLVDIHHAIASRAKDVKAPDYSNETLVSWDDLVEYMIALGSGYGEDVWNVSDLPTILG